MIERKMYSSNEIPDNLHETIMDLIHQITNSLIDVAVANSKVPAELFVVGLNIVFSELIADIAYTCSDEFGSESYIDNEIDVLRKNFELALKRKK